MTPAASAMRRSPPRKAVTRAGAETAEERPLLARALNLTMSETRIIYGFHAVTSRLRQSAASVKELYLDTARDDRRSLELLKAAEERGTRVMRVDEKRLDGMTH